MARLPAIIDPLKTHDCQKTTPRKKAQQSVQKILASEHMPTATSTSFPKCMAHLDPSFRKMCNPIPIGLQVKFKTSPTPTLNDLRKSFQATTGIKATSLRWRAVTHLRITTRSTPLMRTIGTWIPKWPTSPPTPEVQRRSRTAVIITRHQIHHTPHRRDMKMTKLRPVLAEEVIT